MHRQQVFYGILSIIFVALCYLGISNPTTPTYYTLAWLVLVLVLVILGNHHLEKYSNRLYPWERFGKVRFFVQLLISVVYGIVVINTTYLVIKYFFTGDPPIWSQLIVLNVWGIAVIIPSFSLYFGLLFLNQWQASKLDMERYQKETMANRFINLKNHLDPHFLFNNLNILSSLIDKDQALSQKFLVRFAQVYRTLLLNKDEDLILLEEEVDFIKSYIFLLKVRFEKNINFNVQIDKSSMMYMIPPLTIQMLIENAIKHNTITEKTPLNIIISSEDKKLLVINTLNEKKEELKYKSGTGLRNIQARFKYFSDRELVIEKNHDRFSVSIPLLKVETL